MTLEAPLYLPTYLFDCTSSGSADVTSDLCLFLIGFYMPRYYAIEWRVGATLFFSFLSPQPLHFGLDCWAAVNLKFIALSLRESAIELWFLSHLLPMGLSTTPTRRVKSDAFFTLLEF